MKGSMSTDLGIITIDPEVIAKYAGSVAVECFGIVGMAAVSMKDGLVKLLKKESLNKNKKTDSFRRAGFRMCFRFYFARTSSQDTFTPTP